MIVVIVAVVGTCCMIAGFVIDRLIHPGRKRLARLEEFLNDWNGKPERRTPDGAHVLEKRRPGHPERMENVEEDVAGIRKLLNGGGLGSQMATLQGKSDELSGEMQAVKEQVAEVQRFGFRLAQGQERIEAKVNSVEGKVDGRLFELEEAERMHRAALHELGYPVSPDEAPDLD